MSLKPSAAAALLCLVAAMFPSLALATSFTVVPVRIFMKPGDRATSLTLYNGSDTPILLQAESFDWDQSETGEDLLTPSDALILSPPIIQLQPQQEQVVRIALLTAPRPDVEMTYRVFLREVPNQVEAKPGIQLPISLAVSLPVFMTPKRAAADITCALERRSPRPDASSAQAASSSGARLSLAAVCRNAGNATRQIRLATLRAGSSAGPTDGASSEASTALTRSTGPAYVLPGRTQYLPLNEADGVRSGMAATLEIETDDGARRQFAVTVPE